MLMTLVTTARDGTTNAYIVPQDGLAVGTIVRAIQDDVLVRVELTKVQRVTSEDGLEPEPVDTPPPVV